MARQDQSATADLAAVEEALLRAIATRVLDLQKGEWGYLAGTSAVDLVVPGRVLAISAVALASGATLTIDGGTAIPILARFPFTIEPRGNLDSPTLDLTGTDAYFVEYVT